MEEVRSYWQVTSIHHFCNTFGKQFKLPSFEPEELEQAFILDIPAPKLPTTTPTNINTNHNTNSTNNGHIQQHINGEQQNNYASEEKEEEKRLKSPDSADERDKNNDEDYEPPNHILHIPEPQPQVVSNQNDEQDDIHLLVKLATALMKPHFNCKLTHANWENYLKRLVDTYWVELEHCPSPFIVPLISQDGVELTKNLTFNELSLSDKIDLFYALCDYRLWCEDATEALKDYSLEELRIESIGKDSQGYEYWYFSGARLFRENKELSQDIILRKKRIKELEYKLIDLEKTRIFREQEEKRKSELEKAKQQAAEAREARLLAKKQQEQEAKEHSKKKKQSTPILPPRTGLRERRSSAMSNNNESQMRTTRSRLSSQQHETQQQREQTPQQSTQKSSKGKNTRQSNQREDKNSSPDLPKKSPEEECRDELQQLLITKEDRAEAWSLQCESLESWESFATKFEKTKSTNEKYLMAHINEHILPNIRAIYAKKAAEAKRKEKELLLSLTSRRVSTRIISKRAQEEEEERQAQLHEAEMRRKKVEAETRLRAELEREMRAKKNRQLLNGGTSSTCSEDGETFDGHGGRYNLRQQQTAQHYETYESDDFSGIIHPDKLSEFYEALELVIDTVRTSKHAWPFVDPVPATVPGYYDLIKEPMDLRKLRTKIEFREYKSLIELEKDFQLLVNNCEKFNGPKNVYTKMVYKLWKSFRKNVRLYLQRDLFMDEAETFIYPPIMAPPPSLPPQPQQQAHIQAQPDIQPVNNHADKVSRPEEASSQDNRVSQNMAEPSERESVSPCPPRMSPANSPQPPKASPIHETTRATSPPPAKLARLLLTNSDSNPASRDITIPCLPCNQTKEEPLTTLSEEIIIDSYDVDCPDDNFFIWSQDIKPDETVDN